MIDFEIEGFSATQRIIIGSGLRALDISRSNSQGGGDELGATPIMPPIVSGLCCRLCASTE